ncbi:MAG: sensor histidine kinase [Verrucomicrobiota bacterium]
MRIWNILIAVFAVVGLHAEDDDPIRSIREVRELSAEEADLPREVALEGVQVIAANLGDSGVFIHDGSDGIYMAQDFDKPGLLRNIRLGDIIRVRGTTESGGFSPIVFAHEVEVVGNEPLPEAPLFQLDDYYAYEVDCNPFVLAGRLVAISVDENQTSIQLELDHKQTSLLIQLRYTLENYQALKGLLFRRIRLYVVASTLFNDQRQVTGRLFALSSLDLLTPLDEEPNQEQLKTISMSDFMRLGIDHLEAVKTRGTVTHANDGQLILQSGNSNLLVRTANEVDAKIGDLVEIAGFVWPKPLSPAFRAFAVDVLERGPEPVPLRIDDQQPIDRNMNWNLVQLETRLVDIGKSFSPSGLEEWVLLCHSDDYIFEARMPIGSIPEEQVKVGVELQLSGICHLIPDQFTRGESAIDGFWLQLRNASDIKVIKNLPWWTPGKLLLLLAILLVLGVAVLIWALALRQVVSKQTGIIGKQVERETLLKERQRIARELHDNLEQGLVGMAMQLQGTLRILHLNMQRTKKWVNGLDKGDQEAAIADLESGQQRSEQSLQGLQDMLDQCSEESRSSILYLRSGKIGRMGLMAALQEVVEPLAEQAGVALTLEAVGELFVLKQEVERNLLLVIKEAVTNAIRHADANRIRVILIYRPDQLEIVIEDDGIGIDTKAMNKAGHFGIQGMQERIAQLEGQVDISSRPNLGAKVTVCLPAIKQWIID